MLQMPSQNKGDDSPALKDRIRCRAYELYEQRGREEGHDLEDWLAAEKELGGEKKASRFAA